MQLRIVVCVLSISSLGIYASGQVLLREERGQSYLIQDLAIPQALYSYSRIEAVCNSIIQSSRGLPFVRVHIYGTDKRALPLPKPDHLSYEVWRKLFGTSSAKATGVAQLVMIRGDAILRFRSQDAKVVEKVLYGRNPLVLDTKHGRLEILELAVEPAPYRKGSIKLQAWAFIKTGQTLTPELGSGAFEVIRDRLPIPLVAASVRNDCWFISEWRFPLIYPFAPPGQAPPSDEEYSRSTTIHCEGAEGQPRCTASSPGNRR